MYNVTISFNASTANAGSLVLMVLVTDSATAAFVGGLQEAQFTVTDAFDNTIAILGFTEFAAASASGKLLPGVYQIEFNFIKPAGSYAFAVAITALPGPIRHFPPTVLGVGVGTCVILTAVS